MSNISSSENRRRFSRIPFKVSARLIDQNGVTEVDVLDISLNGLLIHKPTNWNAKLGQTFEARLTLENSSVELQMNLSAAHISDDHIGFHCDSLDIDSISHLKRIVELNMADSELLERELHALIER